MRRYIYGAGNGGNRLLNTIISGYPNILIEGVIDERKRGNIQGIPIYQLNQMELENAQIIIAIYDFDVVRQVFLLLKKAGCKDIWWYREEKIIFGRDFYEEQCISCSAWQESMLEHVEMHIMDACNLNCKGCTHFSPIFPMEIPVYEERISDVKKLLKKDLHIVRFFILGGEPFLNPEISRYLIEIRNMMPDTELVIVTNGLMIPTVNDAILKIIREQRIIISISEYVPTHKLIHKIRERLDSYQIIYQIREFSTKEKFNKPLALDCNDSHEKICISNGCITIWNGKIARCPTLMYIDVFNQYFNTQFPAEGVMDIEDCPTGSELTAMLNKNVPLCSYCIKNEIEWERCGNEIKLEDFAE